MFLLQPGLSFAISYSDVLRHYVHRVGGGERAIGRASSGTPHFDSLPQRALPAVTMRFLHTAIERTDERLLASTGTHG